MMNRQQWKDVAEAVGFAAIVASLVFVGIETRNSTKQSELNTQALQIAAYQALMSNIDEMNALSLESPAAAATMALVWEDEATELEEFQLNRVLFILFRHGDLAYFMYERGAIDEKRLKSALAPVPINSDVGRKFWSQRKSAFTDDYQVYVDQLIAEAESGDSSE